MKKNAIIAAVLLTILFCSVFPAESFAETQNSVDKFRYGVMQAGSVIADTIRTVTDDTVCYMTNSAPQVTFKGFVFSLRGVFNNMCIIITAIKKIYNFGIWYFIGMLTVIIILYSYIKFFVPVLRGTPIVPALLGEGLNRLGLCFLTIFLLFPAHFSTLTSSTMPLITWLPMKSIEAGADLAGRVLNMVLPENAETAKYWPSPRSLTGYSIFPRPIASKIISLMENMMAGQEGDQVKSFFVLPITLTPVIAETEVESYYVTTIMDELFLKEKDFSVKEFQRALNRVKQTYGTNVDLSKIEALEQKIRKLTQEERNQNTSITEFLIENAKKALSNTFKIGVGAGLGALAGLITGAGNPALAVLGAITGGLIAHTANTISSDNLIDLIQIGSLLFRSFFAQKIFLIGLTLTFYAAVLTYIIRVILYAYVLPFQIVLIPFSNWGRPIQILITILSFLGTPLVYAGIWFMALVIHGLYMNLILPVSDTVIQGIVSISSNIISMVIGGVLYFIIAIMLPFLFIGSLFYLFFRVPHLLNQMIGAGFQLGLGIGERLRLPLAR